MIGVVKRHSLFWGSFLGMSRRHMKALGDIVFEKEGMGFPGNYQPIMPGVCSGRLRFLGSSVSGTNQGRLVLGVSGGVDSAVAGLLLKKAGYDVVGVFMRNWDESEERDNQGCSVERDLRDASLVCKQLDIPFHEANFVSEYWTEVFTDFLNDYGQGLTPNPDLNCNRFIKFGALLRFANSLGASMIATGHYARIDRDCHGNPKLRMGRDAAKDQSYFLASVHKDALSKAIFPLGDFYKSEVRKIAEGAGLVPARKRSSAGICFIGRRKFGEFLSEYLSPISGQFVCVDSDTDLGECRNMLALTNGQGAGISGAADKFYVVGKDMIHKKVYVCQGRNHPALLTTTAMLVSPHWLSNAHRDKLFSTGNLKCQYKARYRQAPEECILYSLSGSRSPAFTATRYSKLRESSAASNLHQDFLLVHFPSPVKAITPRQNFVMYDQDLCLGTALVLMPGATLHESAS